MIGFLCRTDVCICKVRPSPATSVGKVLAEFLTAPLGSVARSHVRLEHKPFLNLLDVVGIYVVIRRDAFRFLVDSNYHQRVRERRPCTV